LEDGKVEPLWDGGTKNFIPEYWTEDEKVSTIVLHDAAVVPLPKYETKVIPGIETPQSVCVGYSAKYHFRIPYLCLVNRAKVAKMAIYPETITSLQTDMCAYYIVDEGYEIQVPEAGGNFTIIVDWTLNIMNAAE